MFFIFGISNKEKELDFTQTTICSSCGSYGRYQVFLTYTFFSLFFIPIFKWNKKYYVRTSCCNSLYSINNDLGRAIERGEKTNIHESDLHPINVNYHYNKERYCLNCNHKLESEYEYCPKCGTKI